MMWRNVAITLGWRKKRPRVDLQGPKKSTEDALQMSLWHLTGAMEPGRAAQYIYQRHPESAFAGPKPPAPLLVSRFRCQYHESRCIWGLFQIGGLLGLATKFAMACTTTSGHRKKGKSRAAPTCGVPSNPALLHVCTDLRGL